MHALAEARSHLPAVPAVLPASTAKAIAVVREIERTVQSVPQVPILTHHVLHGGMYSRTICIPAGVVLTGALIKVPTTLIISGCATVLVGDAEEALVEGYQVFAASAGRKQAFIAHTDTYLTMSFPTQAVTIEQAEEEFTDEADQLFSRSGVNSIVITGE